MISEEKNKVEKIIESAMNKINLISGSQIIGDKIINENGQAVVPICNLTVAVISGGGEYGDVKIAKAVGDHFAGGDVTVCSVKPTAYVIDNGSGFSVIKNTDIIENISALTKLILEKLK